MSKKYLVLHIDAYLDWTHHICHMAIKMSIRLGVLEKVRKYQNVDTANLLHNSLVFPKFDYCDVVLSIMIWSHMDS